MTDTREHRALCNTRKETQKNGAHRDRSSEVLGGFEYLLLEERIQVTWTESEYKTNHQGSQNKKQNV
jgi:hypothetical protein